MKKFTNKEWHKGYTPESWIEHQFETLFFKMLVLTILVVGGAYLIHRLI